MRHEDGESLVSSNADETDGQQSILQGENVFYHPIKIENMESKDVKAPKDDKGDSSFEMEEEPFFLKEISNRASRE